MDRPALLSNEAVDSLSMALIVSSQAPLLLLDATLTVEGASNSFCNTFQLDPAKVRGMKLAQLGRGKWHVPHLEKLLMATISGNAAVDAYEMDLVREGKKPCRLVLNAHKLDYDDADNIRIVLAVSDITAARLAEKLKDDLVREKQILLQELQHRVANSLQIIASILMQSARKVQSKETKFHLQDTHHRVMSIAKLQKQLAVSQKGEVELRTYLTDLCHSIGESMISDHERLSLTATVDDTHTSPEVSISLGLIVTELVINALKHAFSGQEKAGKIAVDYLAKGDGWTMSVSDNGIGMSAGAGSAKPGLGTGIVDALSKHLDASVTVTDTDPGTQVSIVHD